MRRLDIGGPILALALLVGAGCLTSDRPPSHDPPNPIQGPVSPSDIRGTGTIRYSDLEGGFYLIVSDDGRKFDPLGLDPAFRQDGMRVRFVLRERRDAASIHMVGMIVDVVRIAAI